jgi:hypothetical protein
MVSPVDEPPESSDRQLRSMSNFGTASAAADSCDVLARTLRNAAVANDECDMATSMAAIKNRIQGAVIDRGQRNARGLNNS